jgi:hypothetical protein
MTLMNILKILRAGLLSPYYLNSHAQISWGCSSLAKERGKKGKERKKGRKEERKEGGREGRKRERGRKKERKRKEGKKERKKEILMYNSRLLLDLKCMLI